MRKLIAFSLLLAASCSTLDARDTDAARWEATAKRVTIVRDDWGIPHITAKTDADVIFGMMYAQGEDDFNRVETNFINSQGRLAEAEGEAEIWRDLRMKLFINPDTMKAMYARSPAWLKADMNGWADGLNYFLYKHPEVKPRVLTKFEPWMALTFSEGSIGGDIEAVSLRGLQDFYGAPAATKATGLVEDQSAQRLREPTGSNGFAIGPQITASHHAILWINPHTSFFFRSEAQATSEEGLNVYGASTWGQFFMYQGFNSRLGWMHTTSGIDNVDEYAERITRKGTAYTYKYGSQDKPVSVETISIPYKTASGMVKRDFTVYRTQHGPVIRSLDGKWVTVRLMNEPLKALTQSYSRTKAKSLKDWKQVMELHTNSSNNTLYADADGNFGYLHSNFIPRRDTSFDWTKPVDGSNPATEWKGLHTFDESPNVVNPKNGWAYNSNNWPYTAAGPGNSPDPAKFPKYMDRVGENQRGLHALRVLPARKDYTPQRVIDAAFDSWMPSFDVLIPGLLAAYDQTPASDLVKTKVAEQVQMLRAWDHRWAASSVPTTLAITWADELARASRGAPGGLALDDYLANKTTPAARLQALAAASDLLTRDFGTWKTPWGAVNRFQRLTDDIVHPFADSGPSIPVPFTTARWGSLASFGARRFNGSKKAYGTSGNSFLAVVEFGDSVRARAVTAGGQSGNPKSMHFNDQAERYASGNLRDVYFYKPQLTGHTERTYHPGQ